MKIMTPTAVWTERIFVAACVVILLAWIAGVDFGAWLQWLEVV